MADDLDALANWAEPLLRKLEASERRTLMQSISRELRKSNQERMKQQVDPDGHPWEPRKRRNLRGQSGSIKKKAMFTKLRTSKYLRIRTTPDSAGLAFTGPEGRIAATHHYGLRAKLGQDGPWYNYPERRLLGVSQQDLEMVTDKILEHISP